MSSALAIGLALVLPALGAALVVLAGRWPNVRESMSTLSTLGTFACVASLLPQVHAGARPRLTVLETLPGISLVFEVEPLGMVFGLVASGLWILTSLYAIGYMRGHHEQHQTRFFAYFALAISAALGIAFAGNLFTLFVFYEVLTFSTYPLVTHHGNDEAKRAGRVYLGILVGTSVAFLSLAIVWTWLLAGTIEFRPGGILGGNASPDVLLILLVLYAFGTGKAALMPLHRWLPAAMVAPTPVSALLHAVAVVKAGVFTVLKVVVYVFGVGTLAATGISEWLMVVASITIIVASLVALTRDNLKARLAYSTVSQLSYIVLGAALATANSVVGGGMHIVMHAVGKITLFFCAGAVYVAAHKSEISDMDGIGRRMPFTMGAFFVASLSIIGLPPLGGTWSKWYLGLGAAESHHYVYLAVLMVSSLLNIAYLIPIPVRAFLRPLKPPTNPGHAAHSGIHEAPLLCVVPLCLTALGSVVLFFTAPYVQALLQPLMGP